MVEHFAFDILVWVDEVGVTSKRSFNRQHPVVFL